MLVNGEIPEGRTLRQCSLHRLIMRRRGVFVQPRKRKITSFTPEMDDAIMKGKVPDGVDRSSAKRRRKWLQENFVDVGWGNLIGKQRIEASY